MISAQDIKSLRDETGFSFAQCKKALEESGGDKTKALASLKSQGEAIAQKKSDRAQNAGVVSAYVHGTGSIGAMVILSSETDFVAKNPDFKALAYDLAMHIAAQAPQDVPALLSEPFIKDPAKTVGDLITEAVQKFGENISISRFERFTA